MSRYENDDLFAGPFRHIEHNLKRTSTKICSLCKYLNYNYIHNCGNNWSIPRKDTCTTNYLWLEHTRRKMTLNYEFYNIISFEIFFILFLFDIVAFWQYCMMYIGDHYWHHILKCRILTLHSVFLDFFIP